MLLANATLDDGSIVDVMVDGQRIASVEPAGSGRYPPGHDVHDLAGRLLLPAPAEAHTHLDKALTVDRVPNPAGDLAGAIEAWSAHRPTITTADYVARATTAAELLSANGCTAIRTHVDLGPDVGTTGLEAMLEVKASLAGRLELQVVGLVNGVTGPGGDRQLALLRAALDLGLDVVGGVPHVEAEPAAAIDHVLDLAGTYGRPLDLHADENLDPTSIDLEVLADRVIATGFEPPVVASHCVALGMMDERRQAHLAERSAEAAISVVTLPLTNLYLQARHHPVAPPRGLTAVDALDRAGVTVAAGADNIRDPFCPVGRADPLETAALLVTAAHRTIDQAYRSVSAAARATLGLEPVEIGPGRPADLMALAAADIAEAVAAAPPGRLVIHRGRIVSGT